jgi:hypothetical protein
MAFTPSFVKIGLIQKLRKGKHAEKDQGNLVRLDAFLKKRK